MPALGQRFAAWLQGDDIPQELLWAPAPPERLEPHENAFFTLSAGDIHGRAADIAGSGLVPQFIGGLEPRRAAPAFLTEAEARAAMMADLRAVRLKGGPKHADAAKPLRVQTAEEKAVFRAKECDRKAANILATTGEVTERRGPKTK